MHIYARAFSTSSSDTSRTVISDIYAHCRLFCLLVLFCPGGGDVSVGVDASSEFSFSEDAPFVASRGLPSLLFPADEGGWVGNATYET